MDDAPSAAPTMTLPDPSRSAATIAPGTMIGRFVVVGHLGAGGMGSVYAAFDAQLQRRVAIKVLRPDARGTGGHARLLREAQAMARLTHPNVVTVHEVGAYGDDVFVAMEYVEGETLKRWMGEEHTWRARVAVLREAGKGLAAAHRAGLVHRDFKPENVLIGNDGRVVVADFGIARAGGADDAPSDVLERTLPERPSATASADSTLPTTPRRPSPLPVERPRRSRRRSPRPARSSAPSATSPPSARSTGATMHGAISSASR